MSSQLRELVRRRAEDRCEYCRLPQTAVPFARFHLEHIVALQHGGLTEEENLALACDRCNAYKGTNLTTIDPLTNQVVLVFNPRTQVWHEHFRQIGYKIEGISGCGRASEKLLQMNAERRVQLRAALRILVG